MRHRPVHVLLIEDSPAEARLIEEMLVEVEELSFTLEIVRRLTDGEERLEAGGIDAVLLDLSLPDSRGLQSFDRLHAQAPHIPIVVLTGLEDEALAIDAVRRGAQDYLMKGAVDGHLLTHAVRYAIERKRAEEELRRRNEDLVALNAVAQAVTRSLDLSPILHDALEALLRPEILGARGKGVIFLMDEQEQSLSAAAWLNVSEDLPCLTGSLPLGECLCGLVAQEGRILRSGEEGQELLFPGHWSEIPSRQIGLPLKVHGRVVGVMALKVPEDWEGGGEDLRLLSAAADQIALAVDNARLYGEARRRSRELSTLHKVGQTLTSKLDLEEVLSQLMVEVRTILDAEAASVLLYEKEDDELFFVAAAGPGSEVLVGTRMPASEGIAGWALRQGEPVLVHDAQTDSRFYHSIDDSTGLQTRSLLAVPLKYGERIIGIMEVIHHVPGAFSAHDLDLLVTLAGSAAVAIENARLYQAEQRRREIAEALRVTSRVVNASLNLDEVLPRILEQLAQVIDYDTSAVLLLHEGRLEVRAARGFPNEQEIVGTALDAEEYHLISVILQARGGAEGEMRRGSRWGSRSIISHVHDWIGAPLIVRDEVIGILSVSSNRLGAYTEEDGELVFAFASQVAVAIENARLYEAEREQRRLVEISQARLIQSEKLAATGRLAASLAHEINNPLQVIHNGLQLMLTFPLDPEEQRTYLKMADEEVERLIDMVARMLDFARRPQREMKRVNPNAVLERVLALASKYLQHRRVTLNRDLTADLPPIWGAPDELGQVFLNLVINALDAMPGGGTLRISSRLTPDDRVAIAFTDTGQGIPREHLDRLFEPFFSTKEGGTGLGLTISYNIIERHKGNITVQSVTGEGTCFTVWLPAADGKPQTAPLSMEVTSESG